MRYTREQQIVPLHASCLVKVSPPGVLRTGVVQRQQCVQKLDGGAFEHAAKDHQGDGQNGEELQVAAGVLHQVHRARVMEELPGDPTLRQTWTDTAPGSRNAVFGNHRG